MFGCLGRLGCLAILLIAGAIGWFTQDAWLPKAKAKIRTTAPALSRTLSRIANGTTDGTGSGARSGSTQPIRASRENRVFGS